MNIEIPARTPLSPAAQEMLSAIEQSVKEAQQTAEGLLCECPRCSAKRVNDIIHGYMGTVLALNNVPEERRQDCANAMRELVHDLPHRVLDLAQTRAHSRN